jgi:catalase
LFTLAVPLHMAVFQPLPKPESDHQSGLSFRPGKITPVFVRFSTVQGGAGSADTVRDIRGFATKFYTDEGIFDLVGNNTPIFFIQDAHKFPDFVHAVKPEPHWAIPQGQSAHDTFWDYVSLQRNAAQRHVGNVGQRHSAKLAHDGRVWYSPSA